MPLVRFDWHFTQHPLIKWQSVNQWNGKKLFYFFGICIHFSVNSRCQSIAAGWKKKHFQSLMLRALLDFQVHFLKIENFHSRKVSLAQDHLFYFFFSLLLSCASHEFDRVPFFLVFSISFYYVNILCNIEWIPVHAVGGYFSTSWENDALSGE